MKLALIENGQNRIGKTSVKLVAPSKAWITKKSVVFPLWPQSFNNNACITFMLFLVIFEDSKNGN